MIYLFLKQVIGYLKHNWYYTIIIGYFLLSVFLLPLIDITIPCLFKTFFNIHCPGCGLTRSFTSLIKLDFVGAFNYNWLIFIIIPSIIYYVIIDFKKFIFE